MHTIDWLKGQGWFDVTQYRLGLDSGVKLHFSRLTELPIAGLILFFRFLGIEWVRAGILTAALWPLVLFGCFLYVIRWVAQSFLTSDWTRVTAYVALFSGSATINYMVGRIDHHGLSLLFIFFAYGCIVRLMAKPEALKWSIAAACALATGLAIALETLPFFLILAGWMGGWMISSGRRAVPAGMLFGTSLFLSSAIFLAALRPYAEWTNPDVLAYSGVYVALSALIAFCFLGGGFAVAREWSFNQRAAVGCSLAILSGVAFLSSFPALITGPYGGLEAEFSKMMFSNIAEMQPLARIRYSVPTILLVWASILGCFAVMPKQTDKDRWMAWLLTFLLICAAGLLTSFYQVRCAYYVCAFGIIPLTQFLKQSLAWASVHWKGRKLAAIELGLILLVGPLPSVLIPALLDGRSFNQGVLLFPVRYPDKRDCTSQEIEAALHKMGTDIKPYRILNSVNHGAQILFYTPHSVLAAPYHTNPTGIMDSYHFFKTKSVQEAKRYIDKHKVDWVFLCKPLSSQAGDRERDDADISNRDQFFPQDLSWSYVSNKLTEYLQSEKSQDQKKTAPSFAKQMTDGNLPPWLELAPSFQLSEKALIFVVKQDTP